MGSPAGNWFDQNAPAATAPPPSSGSGGDWFAQNSPSASVQTAPSDKPLLDQLASNPNNIPLDSYTHATERGLANIGQGLYQAAQGTVQAVRHPIDTIKNLASTFGTDEFGIVNPQGVNQVHQAVNHVNQAVHEATSSPLAAGDAAGRGAGQAIAAVVGPKIVEGAIKIPFAAARAIRAAKTLTQVPEALGQDATATLATVADREGLPPLQSETVREASDELSKSFINRAKSNYGVVDKAVGGDLKPVQEKITSLKKAIRVNANTNPDLADKYVDQLAEQQKTLHDLVQRAKASGVPNAEDLMKAGDADYLKGKSMEKVAARIKTAAGEAKTGGHPDPASFANQVDVLNNKGVLAQALGKDGADAFVKVAREGLANARQAKTISSTPGVQTVVKLTKGVKAAARLPKQTPAP